MKIIVDFSPETVYSLHMDSHLEAAFEDRTHIEDPEQGWPGDGSGVDDLADHNANEADDYRDEGREDNFGE